MFLWKNKIRIQNIIISSFNIILKIFSKDNLILNISKYVPGKL